MDYDVAIIGAGPAGSTLSSLLKKYSPDLKVVVFERETFPRDHIGESLLSPTCPILVEMGCWDKIDSAEFPIKIGATYRWGKNPELWDFNFYPPEDWKDEPRPAPFAGARTFTAFQVNRSIYDKILLENSESLGVEVRQATKVNKIHKEGDRVTGFELESGEVVTAKYYVDASGNSGILRRVMGVDCEYPSSLKNIAIYDYWQNTEWASKVGVGATRILVLTLGYGWLWFIPLGPTRTSIGVVMPADYFKKTGKTPDEVYYEALKSEARIGELTKNATSEGKLTATRDWSFLADRQFGENWFLIGECAGFADPILSAGVTMAHIAGKELACTILELERGKLDPVWLKDEFQSRQTQRINTHIRFGDYWYTANAQFTDLKEYTQELARNVGIELSPEKAWDWIARGGFIDEESAVGTGGFSLAFLRNSGEYLTDVKPGDPLEEFNVFTLDLENADQKIVGVYESGQIKRRKCFVREGRVLPMVDIIPIVIQVLLEESAIHRIFAALQSVQAQHQGDPIFENLFSRSMDYIEGMVRDGWLIASYDSQLPKTKRPKDSGGFAKNVDTN